MMHEAKMKLLLCAWSVVLVHAAVEKTPDIQINGVHYQKELLYDNISIPNALCVDYTNSYLYFRVNRSLTAKINLRTRQFSNIDAIVEASTLTIDQDTQDVYIGTTEGIYKYNSSTDKSERVAAAGQNIWNIHFAGVLYYNAYKSTDVYQFTDGKSEVFAKLDGTVKRFYIHNGDVVYYSYDSVLYKQKVGGRAEVLYNGDFVTAVVADRFGKLYFSTTGGIYEILNEGTKVNKILTIKESRGMVFDEENNIIYSDLNSIYLLKPIIEMSDIKKHLEYMETKIDNLERRIDNQLTEILEQLRQCTKCSPRNELTENVAASMGDRHQI